MRSGRQVVRGDWMEGDPGVTVGVAVGVLKLGGYGMGRCGRGQSQAE